MEMTMQLSRTVKGQDEIFKLGHTLRPRHRQLLFCIGDGISFGELCQKHPKCVELESMVNELLQSGFIQTLRGNPVSSAQRSAQAAQAGHPIAQAPAAAASAAAAGVIEAQAYVLSFMAGLVGTKSPAYRQMSEVRDLASFDALLPLCRKVIAAVASPHQAAEMAAGVDQRLGR